MMTFPGAAISIPLLLSAIYISETGILFSKCSKTFIDFIYPKATMS